MNQAATQTSGQWPLLTDDRFLEMLAKDVDVLDTTPADALKGTAREMRSLRAFQYATLPARVWRGYVGEPIVAPDDVFFSEFAR